MMLSEATQKGLEVKTKYKTKLRNKAIVPCGQIASDFELAAFRRRCIYVFIVEGRGQGSSKEFQDAACFQWS